MLRDHLLSREAATIQAVACTYDDAAFEQKWGLAFYCKDVLTCGLQKSKEEAGWVRISYTARCCDGK